MSGPAAGPEQLTREQADDVATITACLVLREKLRGWRISASLKDPEGLARVAFTLMDIAEAVMLRQGQDAGETEAEARDTAAEWLSGHAEEAAVRLAQSGLVFNPGAAVLGAGEPAL